MNAHSESALPGEGVAASQSLGRQLGMWTFLATEVLFFGGMFLAYFVYRETYPDAFAAGSRTLNLWRGTVNTAVLLTSSLSIALGDAFLKRGNRSASRRCVIATVLLGVLFLGIKFSEYSEMYGKHLVPGLAGEGALSPQEQLFLILYFSMTGVHALHMIIGVGVMAWLLRLGHRGLLSAENHAPLEMAGLYWHFVDCVWVFLYPLLYLIPHSR